MPGKRKRYSPPLSEPTVQDTSHGQVKPLSAVAAAKLKAQSLSNPGSLKELSPSPSLEPSMSDVESEDEEEHNEERRNIPLCNWRNEERNIIADDAERLIVTLDKNKTIAFIGSYSFLVLKGAINISGANLVANPRLKERTQWHHVYAPCTHPVPVIRGLDDSNEIEFRSGDLQAPLSANPLFADIWTPERNGSDRSFFLVNESDSDPLQRPILPELAPDDWTRQIEELASIPSTVMITGSRTCGKSIFARRLLNRYLTGYGKSVPALPAVCYLDLDPMRPEYSPHGQISLVLARSINLSPPYMHPTAESAHSTSHEIVRAHSIGIKDVQTYADHYVSCVEDLFRTYIALKQQHTALPLIIRIPSWISSTNIDLLSRLINYIKPRILVRFGDLQDEDDVGNINEEALKALASRLRFSIYQLSGQGDLDISYRTEKELRSMQMLSYFHSVAIRHEYSTDPISETAPLELHYEKDYSQQGCVGFLMLCEWIEPSHIMAALNGALVQIVETEDLNIQQLYGGLPRTNKFRIPYFDKGLNGIVEPLNPRTSRLVCTALLRGWDPDRKVAHIIVPPTYAALVQDLEPSKTVIVFGCCEYPEWAYTEDTHGDEQEQAASKGLTTSDREVSLPWIATKSSIQNMAFLTTPRRVRKFQQ